jgi:apolipoprotein D and lipocalin family protein
MMPFLRFLAPALMLWLGAGCATMPNATPNLAPVSSVDLDRYLGRWHVIAATPNFFEKGKVATADTYARREDGTLQANYSFRKGSLDAPEQEWKGVATIVNRETNAEWKVQLLWPFSADYLILELDPDYRWAVVASRGGKWLWILARDTTLPPATEEDLRQRITARGLDALRLDPVPQPVGTRRTES